MIGILRVNNPGNQGLLIGYAFVLKLSGIINGQNAATLRFDGPVYNLLHTFLFRDQPVANYTAGFIAALLVTVQAIWFNRMCIDAKMFIRNNYLPGLSYLLLTSFFPQWLQLSAPMIVATILMWVWYRSSLLFNRPRELGTIYNLGFWLGLASLIYLPAFLFIIFLVLAVNTMQTFRIRNNIISLFGLATPYYLVAAVLFLTDRLQLLQLPLFRFFYPNPEQHILSWLSLALIVAGLVLGLGLLNNNINRQVVHVRKSWTLMQYYLLVSIMVALISDNGHLASWILLCIPLSIIIAGGFAYVQKKVVANSLHWLMFATAIAVGYFYNML